MKRFGPDSLHSWFIATYCSLLSMLLYGVVRLSGVLFVASMSRFQVDRQQASLPYILCDCLQAMAGPLAGFLSVKFGTQPIVLIGSLIASVGTGACFFAESIGTVTVLWGIVYGFGFGLSSLLLPVIITQHFLTKRATAIGIVYFGSYVGFSILPTITDFLIQAYGLSGTFLWLSGFLLHCVPLSMRLSEPKFDAQEIQEMAKLECDRMSFINGRRASFLMEPKGTSAVELCPNSPYSICKPRIAIKETFKKRDKNVIPIAFRTLSENWIENDTKERTLEKCCSHTMNTIHVVSELQRKGIKSELKHTTSNSSFGAQNFALVSDIILEHDPEETLNNKVGLRLEKVENCTYPEDNCKCDAMKPSGAQDNSFSSEDITKLDVKKSPSNENATEHNKLFYSEDSIVSAVVNPKHKNLEEQDVSDQRDSSHSLPENIQCEPIYTPTVNIIRTNLVDVTDDICLKGVEKDFKDPQCFPQVSTIPVKSNESDENLTICIKTAKEFSGSAIPDSLDDPQQRSFTNTKPSKQNWATRDALKIFLEPVFLLVLFSAAMFVSSFITFITVIVDFTKDLGLQESDGKYVIMALSVASNMGLLSFGWVTDGGYMTLTNFAGLLFLLRTFTLILVPYSTGFGSPIGIVFIQGFCESSLGNVFPLIVADYYTEGIHELAISCTLFMCGPTYLATPPLIGYFRDGLGSYLYLFLLMAIMSLTCSVLLFLTPILEKYRCSRDDWILRKRNN